MRRLAPSVLLLGLLACRHSSLTDRLRARAAFDMQCGADELELLPLGQRAYGIELQYGVTGCGQRGTYVLTGSSWILNSDTTEERGSKAPSTSTERVRPRVAAQSSELTPDQTDAPSSEPSTCDSAYKHVGEFADVWAEWYEIGRTSCRERV